jgi:hypothetical protein
MNNINVRLVRKLENLARFFLGPSVDKVFRTGFTSSEAFGEDGKDTKSGMLSSRPSATRA